MPDEVLNLVDTPKRRGRPPKPKIPMPEPMPKDTAGPGEYDLHRVLEVFLGKPEVLRMRQDGSYPLVFERYRAQAAQAVEWEEQTPCPHCHARPGHNQLTGVHVRSWDAAIHSYIDGHHSNCKILMLPAR